MTVDGPCRQQDIPSPRERPCDELLATGTCISPNVVEVSNHRCSPDQAVCALCLVGQVSLDCCANGGLLADLIGAEAEGRY